MHEMHENQHPSTSIDEKKRKEHLAFSSLDMQK